MGNRALARKGIYQPHLIAAGLRTNATREVVHFPDRRTRTGAEVGDGVSNADGFLRIIDHIKDMIITGGSNVYPREVEDALETHPAVAATSVFVVPHERCGEAVNAAVILRNPGAVPPEELIARVPKLKGSHQALKTVQFIDELPLTPVGKPDKKALRSRCTMVSAGSWAWADRKREEHEG